MQIDGEYYFVREPSGKEVRLNVDRETNMLGTVSIKAGDSVEAVVTPANHAQSIKKIE